MRYSDYFGFPLTFNELYTRLIQTACSRATLTQSLIGLIQKGEITKTRGYYHLPNHQNLVAQRLRLAQLSAPLLKQATHLTSQISHVPGVLALYLTGSLALSNTDGNADIDIMVITQPGLLWTTRLLLTLYTSILGLRRTPTSIDNQGKLCLNLYLTPSSFTLPASRRSLYSAYELIQAVPLFDPYHTHAALLFANPWLSSYLPNFALPKMTFLNRNARLQVEQDSTAVGRRVLNGLLNYIESLTYTLQRFYMRRRLTREYISRNAAFFHPHDPSKTILSKLRFLS